MSLRRSSSLCVPSAFFVATLLGLCGSASAAEPAAATAAPAASEPIRFTLDLHGGLVYRVGPLDGVDLARGGGLMGVTALIAPKPFFDVGAGYERWFLGRERVDASAGSVTETARTLDALWLVGRYFLYRGEDIGLFVALGAGPAWQGVGLSATRVVESPSGQVRSESYQCSGHGFGGVGLRAGVGADFSLSSLIGMSASLGFDHLRVYGDSLDGCANGLGPASYLSARIGFTIGTGREKPPEPKPEEKAPPPSDRDNDRIVDAQDACPDVAGVASEDPKKNGCPPPSDRDKDGIVDEQDACPDEAGVASEDPKKNGCPPPKDRDGDSVIDEQDACPDTPGVVTQDPATNGCPGDTDEDGIRDDKDACPKEKGVANEDPAKNGCPVVQVTEKEIVISQQVQFQTDRALILPASYSLLDEVAQVIKKHPEIVKLEVQGHTDDRGTKIHNKILSQARADAVRKALVQRGVDAKKLTAVGYGADQPIADNSTDEGRAKNRRVQFKIVEKKAAAPEGEKPAEGKSEEKKP